MYNDVFKHTELSLLRIFITRMITSIVSRVAQSV